MDLRTQVTENFQQQFGGPPHYIVRAPGRVNLIGEHTDYNDGFVLPMAIDRATWIALRPSAASRLTLVALNHEDNLTFDLSDFGKQAGHWGEYAKGVAWALQQQGYELKGWEGVMACDVPMGAGLSSSASYELAVARAFAAVSGFGWDARAMALLGQTAENQWVGVNCGIMDQMISAAGRDGHALLIDCRSLDCTPVRLPTDTVVVILDTSTRRGLVDSQYNERRTQCEQAAAFFGVTALRDVSIDQFTARADALEELPRRRARHVITENARTEEAAVTTDPVVFGQLMNASHDSLRDDFEVTNEALNQIVDCARAVPGCYGARMTGAGFGGCAVALVAAEAADQFVSAIGPAYRTRSGLEPKIYVCQATKGASLD